MVRRNGHCLYPREIIRTGRVTSGSQRGASRAELPDLVIVQRRGVLVHTAG